MGASEGTGNEGYVMDFEFQDYGPPDAVRQRKVRKIEERVLRERQAIIDRINEQMCPECEGSGARKRNDHFRRDKRRCEQCSGSGVVS